ncbi:mandelate racemase/muconate lactonizing enzyme family protein [Haladaptatus caseinilyticus]|uniref:mandelate racemase/muconate lactonizing enzyme family protein n=1 Tax=Haladaptatus caseinilyticus TaxID=2993314 RepID=UPI00224AA618|nr:enolase C-terminal domain-like protein [Haladaptatus caseinilyticus]
MNIVDVHGYALSSPIDPVQSRRFHAGTRRLLKRDVVLVVVETVNGARGFAPAGASSSAMREYFDGESQGNFADVINGPVADELEGKTIDDIERVHSLIKTMDFPVRLRNQIRSVIDVSLYDLLGKQVGAPIYELLCERHDTAATTELPLYASAGMYMDPEGYVRQAEILDDLGFFGYKYRPGIGPKGDRRIVERLVEAVEMEIMVDAHTWWKMDGQSYGTETVTSLVEHAATHDVYWVEEPVDPDDYDGYRALCDNRVSLAGGESEESAPGLLELGRTGAVDFLQGDVRHHGGFSGCWDAAEFCIDRDVTFVPHNFGTWLGLIANAHLTAAVSQAELLEYPVFENDPALESSADPGMYPFDLAFDLVDGTPNIDSGVLTVPDGPGLGIDVDMDVIEDYPFVEGAWTEFSYDE